MSVRRIALLALLDITEGGAYANLRLKEAERGLPRQDAKWVSAAVYETLDHLIYIDYVLSRYTKGRQKPAIRGILRMGVCQVMFMGTPPSAACNESVKLAKEIGKGALAGYVNGVLRAVCRDAGQAVPLPENARERLSVQYSYPRWLVDLYADAYGETFTEAMLSAEVRELTIRAQAPYTAEELEAWLAAQKIPYSRGTAVPEAFRLQAGFDIAAEPLFQNGQITVQSESAMLVCRALGARPGMRVLDACAAPGGKTAYLSMLMENAGRIDAWELHAHRCELMKKTLDRLRVKNAEILQRDASKRYPECGEAYDAVLLDAPCSGLGVHGKPDARYGKSLAVIQELAALQAQLLDCCASCVKPGGVLVYSTCTISPPENEACARAFLARHGEFDAVGFDACLPEPLRKRAAGGMLQLFPHLDGMEGFFLAKFTRKRAE
ncbi:MAG: 16S rRNA (cytosine(967)-C(5))-methyltransferase RsmB [Christensenella sp.]|jgi:16S rRNA (cytosine967-C5)-methyltransferase|nr:16S rRNA (cytosine(967)-C(5))-methyltransferase RsmB [Christensenella sp.]